MSTAGCGRRIPPRERVVRLAAQRPSRQRRRLVRAVDMEDDVRRHGDETVRDSEMKRKRRASETLVRPGGSSNYFGAGTNYVSGLDDRIDASSGSLSPRPYATAAPPRATQRHRSRLSPVLRTNSP